ncbi:MAG: hypothetical protein O3A33_01130 [Chloroflexi bacterium]|nr:hypothetical protein [Chloroflexota bacterium]
MMPSIPNQKNRNDGLERELKVCRQLALSPEAGVLVTEDAVSSETSLKFTSPVSSVGCASSPLASSAK